MGYIYSKSKNRLLSERPRTFRDRRDSFHRRYINPINQDSNISKEREEQLKDFDQRYAVIVNLFMAEVNKRKVDINSADFDEKMNEILQTIFHSTFFKKRFPKESLVDIKSTILRRVAAERHKQYTTTRDSK